MDKTELLEKLKQAQAAKKAADQEKAKVFMEKMKALAEKAKK
jgi:hypothetical protein